MVVDNNRLPFYTDHATVESKVMCQPATFISERVVNVYLKFQWVKNNENSARTNNVVLMKREGNVRSDMSQNNQQTTATS